MEFVSLNAQETQEMAYNFAKEFLREKNRRKHAVFIALQGELGAGKTTFAQGFAKGFGIEEQITSPTFVIFKMYSMPLGKWFKKLVHVDCYRLKEAKELELLGFRDVLKDPMNIILMEWPERVNGIVPKNRILVHIDHMSENSRKISMN